MPVISESLKTNGIGLRIVNGANQLNSDGISDETIHINCCGYNLFDPSVRRIEISRPSGRLDYQLIYIQEGSGDFVINGKKQVLYKESLIVYRPHVPQMYSFHNTERTVAYFIHFSGTAAESLVDSIGTSNGMVYKMEKGLFFSEYIFKIIRELQVHEYHYELMCASYLFDMVCQIGRAIHSDVPQVTEKSNNFASALYVMNNQFHKDLSIDEYAKMCGMSTYYFVRKFKEHTGYSPHYYVIRIRMERAKEFLVTTDMNVSEISFAVGYDNPLYFSRMFKKYTGTSPLHYKKQMSTSVVYLADELDEEEDFK